MSFEAMMILEIYSLASFMACGSVSPWAMYVAMADDRVQPVPCRLVVSTFADG